MPLPAGYVLDKSAKSGAAPKLPPGYALDSAPPEVATAASSAPAPVSASAEQPPPQGFWASAIAPFVGVAKGIKSAVYEGPQNPQEDLIANAGRRPGVSLWEDATPIVGRAVLAAKRMLVDPQIDQGRQAISEFQKTNPHHWGSGITEAEKIHREMAAGHGIAAMLPVVGPWAAQVGEKEGEQIGTGNYKGAAGTAAGNIALALAPKAAGKALGAVPDVAVGATRRLAGSGPGVARELARAAIEDNRKIAIDNAHTLAAAKRTWQEKYDKAAADHKAESLRVSQKYKLTDKPTYDRRVQEAKDKFSADRAKAQSDYAEAQRAYNRKIGETAQHNQAVTIAERAKTDQAAHLQVGGSQLIYGLNQLDRALRAKVGEMYDAIREKVG